ncbi:14592_t:CDS:2, partial [Funneliformis geosporum]
MIEIEEAKKINTYELGYYPKYPIITYKEVKNNITQRTFNYFIETEGFYPKISELCYTLPPKKYPIPDNLSIKKTTWGNKIKYKNGNPEFQILFGSDFEHFFIWTITIWITTSKLRESRVKQNLIKPAEQYSQSSLNNRAKEIGTIIKKEFIQTEILNIIKVMDSNYISRDAYRNLAAINYHLPREYIIANEQNRLTQEMIKKIPMRLINMNTNAVLNSIDTGGQRDFALYSGVEKYESIELILSSFLNDLKDLKNNGLEIAGFLWHFELYFSSDWKFLAICLGLNAANSNYFCAWCLCSKQEINDTTLNWRITKSINDLKINCFNTPGHIKAPLFDMIPLYNY